MKKLRRISAGFLAAAVLASAMPVTAEAGAPAVTTDEALYVNLDYYGKITQANVVKGCSLNGNTKFTDYGSYENVTNMTDEAKPVVSGDSVTWNLPQNTDRFYYQGTLKNQSVTLPWSLDVSYKLNGVPTDASKLAGASGTVEIDIQATPNKNVSDYYKNDMLLQVGTAFKMKDTLSVEAPGAQQQSIGDYKAVLFAGLPGEEKTYTIRVGTKSFETVGILIMMVPGTLDQFKDIKDLKEDKDTVKGSLDSINEGTDQILTSLEAMTGGITQVQSGLGSADQARSTISAGKGNVYQNADSAIADLSTISKQTSALIPHMQEGQNAIQDVNKDINNLNTTLQSTSGSLNALSSHISSLRDNINDLRDTLTDLDDETSKSQNVNDDLESELKTLKTGLPTLKSYIDGLNNSLYSPDTSADNLYNDTNKLKSTLDAIAKSPYSVSDPVLNQALRLISSSSSSALSGLDNSVKYSYAVSSGISGLTGQASSFIDTEQDLISQLNSYLSILHDGHESADKFLRNSSLIAADIQSLLDTSQTMLTNINTLNNTANKYKDGAVNTLKDTASLTGSLANGLNSSKNFLTSLETLMQTSGSQLDDAAKKSLSGSIDVLQKSLDGISKTNTVKNASDAINKAVNKEIDKYEKDNNLLNMDAEAKPVSFTSSKNSTPSSIQVVMRTQEISKDSGKNQTEDLEKTGNTSNPLVRIQSVFIKIWNAIKSIFSD